MECFKFALLNSVTVARRSIYVFHPWSIKVDEFDQKTSDKYFINVKVEKGFYKVMSTE